ncbi:hypothetical protein ACH4GK_28735 [Streptomyces rimosus]|nr:hypothetical protein [Streptomyces rimosus]
MARIVIQKPSSTGGRRVRVDDPSWVEWRGGWPHDYGGGGLSSA